MLIYQPLDGYCYNSDTLFLYDFISSFKPKKRVLDVGVGSGVLGLLIARDFPKVTLSGVEKQEIFVQLAKINARVNKIDYTIYHRDFLALSEEIKYDFIVSNPPFYHDGVTKSQNEILYNARYSINLTLESFFQKVKRLLNPNSHFIFCYDASQFGLVCEELAKAKLRAVDVRFVYPKKDRSASLVMIHAKNGSKSLMKILPPLFGFENNEFSQEAKEIYKKVALQSIKCQI